MLSQSEIEAMTSNLTDIYDSIENDLLVNVSKRFSVLEEVTPDTAAAWQTDKLQQLGALRKENIAILSKQSGKTEKEIKKILTEAGYKTLEFDEQLYQMAFENGLLPMAPIPINASPLLKQVLSGAIQNTRKFMNTINTTALESANQAFLNIINQTYLETSLGVCDYNTSIRKAVRQLADQGITGANYISTKGKQTRNHIDVAVRRCLVTSTSQTAGIMQISRAKEWGSNLVEVTSHMGARPDHAVWQGKIFSLEGSTPKYPNLAATTGYGTVTGLKGANCSHDFYPFFEGISEQTYKPYPKEENEKVYEESQVQRKLERDIREQKRRILTANEIGDTEGKVKAQLALKNKEAQLKAFVKETGRTQRTNRQQLMKFGHSEASKAVWAERSGYSRYSKVLGAENMPKSLEEFKRIKYTDNERYKKIKQEFKAKIPTMEYNEIEFLKGSLSNTDVRKWYNFHDKRIPDIIDKTESIEKQARQAHALRNQYRTQARDLMKDQEERKRLDIQHPNETFEQTISRKMNEKALTREQAIADTLKTASKTNSGVNKKFGLED